MLSNIFKYRTTPGSLSGFNQLKTDLNSQLIPGLENGPENVAGSIYLLKHLSGLGFEKAITTPLIYCSAHAHLLDQIDHNAALLKAEVEKQNLNIELVVSAKYHLDADLAAYAQNAPLQCFHKNQVLIKLLAEDFTQKQLNTLKLLVQEGYVPVIAHPEKYKFFKNMQDLKPVMALGCLFQVNIISLSGYYGSVVQGLSQKLVRNNMVAYLGTELRTLKQAFALDRALHKPAVVTSITQQTFRNASL